MLAAGSKVTSCYKAGADAQRAGSGLPCIWLRWRGCLISQDFPAAWVTSAPPALCCQTVPEPTHCGEMETKLFLRLNPHCIAQYLWVLWPLPSPFQPFYSCPACQGLGTIPASQIHFHIGCLLCHTPRMTLLTRLVEKLFSHKILVQHNLNIPWDHFHLAKEPDIMLLTHLFQAARSSLLCLWLCSCAGRGRVLCHPCTHCCWADLTGSSHRFSP